MNELPVELVSEILQWIECDTVTLASLSRVSRVLSIETNNFLYRNVVHNRPNQASIRRSTQFLRTIVHSPRLALLVISYCVTISGYNDFGTFIKLLRPALEAMVNLKHLVIDQILLAATGARIPGPIMAGLLADCKFKLATLKWLAEKVDEEAFTRFLANQDALEELYINWRSDEDVLGSELVKVPSSFCPRLATLCGGIGTHIMFLPGRNVQEVILATQRLPVDLDGNMRWSLFSIEEELRRIRILRCSTTSGYIHPRLFSYLQSLESLHLIGKYNEQHIKSISHNPTVRMITFYGVPDADLGLPPVLGAETASEMLFRGCTVLERVDCVTEMGHRQLEKRWSRWVRDIDGGSEKGFVRSEIIPGTIALADLSKAVDPTLLTGF